MKQLEPKDRIIVALDDMGGNQAVNVVNQLRDDVGMFKIGLELIHSGEANDVADSIVACGGRYFRDSKLLDIPNTVAKATRSIIRLPGVKFFNLHCSGGVRMIGAATDMVDEYWEDQKLPLDQKPITVGVTVLTHTGGEDLREDGYQFGNQPGEEAAFINALVAKRTKVGVRGGLNAFVTSPREIQTVREICGPKGIIITPGVRPLWADNNDQNRVMTPAEAIKAGADYLVIGRPIINTKYGPIEYNVKRIVDEIASVS